MRPSYDNVCPVFAAILRPMRAEAFIGVLGACQGVGAVAGGLLAAAALHRVGDGRLVGIGLLLFAAGDALLVSGALAPILLGFAIAGCGIS